MTHMLEDLVIDRVDLVDEGANSAAHITIYKRKETSELATVQEILESMQDEHAEVLKGRISELEASVAEQTAKAATAEEELSKAKETMKIAEEEKAEAERMAAEKAIADKEATEAEEAEASKKLDEVETWKKSLPDEARAYLDELQAKAEAAEAAEAELAKRREQEAENIAKAKAAELKALPVEQDVLVGIAKSASSEVLEVFTTLAKAFEESVLGEVGKAKHEASEATGSAWETIDKKAKVLAKEEGISIEKARTKVMTDEPELYKKYTEEEN